MSSTAGTAKKRKKTDSKPQSQLNKCLNEKRRREQENIYIEELAELISASFADMSSLAVKPDKCAILQETVTQIKKIKEQECVGSDAVQQGEVSSSKPNIITNEVFGSLLLEALEGFLFVVNTEGKVEYVTDNVSQFIKYTREEVVGNSIYNILHHGDHARFSSCLLPMTVGWADSAPQPRNRTFNVRLLVKPPDDSSQTMEQKQQRISKYENMQMSCTQLFQGGAIDDEGEGGPCLMCLARRIPPNEKHLGAPIEQFTMKLDTQGNVVNVDTSGLTSNYSHYINKEVKGRSLKELCHPGDVNKLLNHVKETVEGGSATSAVYRLRLAQEKHLHVQTKSKLFRASSSGLHSESDFIMATHSIIGDSDRLLNEVAVMSPGGHSMGGNTAVGGSASQASVGGPLISSVNGTPRPSDLTNSSLNSVSLNSTDLCFEFDILPSSTWDLMVGEDRGWVDRGTQSPLYSASSAHSAFPFSPLPSEADDQSETNDSAKLRDLLTKRPSTDSSDAESTSAKNRILKNLLNQEDDDNEPPKPVVSSAPSTPAHNNMLLKLLNEKSDDDIEARAGIKKQNELLQQLLKDEESTPESQHQQSDDSLFKGVSVSGCSPAGSTVGGARKRPSSEEEDLGGQHKRNILGGGPEVGGGGGVGSAPQSKLWEKNKMLASLLAKQPSTPVTIPPIPASVISATPQDKLPRLKPPPPPAQNPTHQPTVVSGAWSGGCRVTTMGAARPRPQQQPASLQQWDQHASSDPVLSDLLDQVIEIVPDAGTDTPALMNIISTETPVTTSAVGGFSQDLINEKMAINAIQKSLMQCETAVKIPVYTNSVMGNNQQQQQQQQFPPPPIYQQRQRIQSQLQSTSVARQSNQFLITQNLLQQQQRSKVLQAQQLQQKQRLLQQQQQQQMLIPSNATAAASDPNLHNIGSLINDSVAPNVALQRSGGGGGVSEAQLSPGYGSAPANSPIINSSQISPRQPYSPQPFSPVSYQGSGGGGGGGAAVPQQPQQQQSRLSPSGLATYQAAASQLSPRIPTPQQQTGGGTQTGFQQAQQQGTTWSQQQARVSLQQQQNPMLNAQLAAGSSFASNRGPGAAATAPGGFSGLPPVRSLTSPGTRQSPFPPELSPTSASSYQFRLQRSTSGPPQATTQLPGVMRHHYSKEAAYGHHPPPHHHSPMYQEYYEPPPLYQAPVRHPLPGTASAAAAVAVAGGGSNGMTEYVRQELRAVVGARTGTQQRSLHHHHAGHDHLEELPISFDISPPPPQAGVSEGGKMWASLTDMGSSSPQSTPSPHNTRTSVEEVSSRSSSGDHKSSLLQKLLSE